MLSFAVITARDAPALGPAVLTRLRTAVGDGSLDHQVAHAVESRHLWVNPQGSVAAIGWWSGWDGYGSGVPWNGHDGLVAFSGRLWPSGTGWMAGSPWAEQLRSHLEQRGSSSLGLNGQYCAVQLDAHGAGTLFTDDVGLRAAYHGFGDGMHVAGSSARLVATLLAGGIDPPRDAVAVGWLAHAGVVLDDESTGFAAVGRVPHGARLRIDAGGTRVVPGPTPFDVAYEGDRSVADAVSELVEHLTGELTVLAGLSDHQTVVGLTGGKDSRTLLAAALLAGVADQLRFHTFGRPGLPDQLVAGRLRDRYQLRTPDDASRPVERDRRWQLAGTDDRWDSARRAVFASSGLLSLWDMEMPSAPAPWLFMTGLGGEVLSTNYRPTTTNARRPHDVYGFLYRGQKVGATGLVREEVAVEYDRVTDQLAEQLLAESADVHEAIDRFYLRVRMNRRFGVVDEWDPTSQVRPLLTSTAAALGRSIGSAARRSEVLEYGVMVAADPGLVTEPFAEDAWSDSLAGFAGQSSTVGSVSREPGILGRTGQAIGSWWQRSSIGSGNSGLADPTPPEAPDRARRTVVSVEDSAAAQGKTMVGDERRAALADANARLMRELLLDEPSNPAFDVLDRDAVTALARRYPNIPAVHERHLLGAATAVAWMGGHELRPYRG